MDVMLFGIVKIPFKLLQSSKTPSSMLVMLLGSSIPVKPLQRLKEHFPIDVTLLGIINLPVKPLQPQKAYCHIVITLFGISNCVNPTQSRNAKSTITVTL